MGLKLTTPRVADAVTLAEAKDHMRILTTDDDTFITALITAATNYFERITSRHTVNASYTLKLQEFPANNGAIILPRVPFSSVTDATYRTGVLTTPDLDYLIDDTGDSRHAYIVPEYGANWPTGLYMEDLHPIVIEYVVGYGAAVTDVPLDIKHAVNFIVSHWFENREPELIGTISKTIPHTINALLWTFNSGYMDPVS